MVWLWGLKFTMAVGLWGGRNGGRKDPLGGERGWRRQAWKMGACWEAAFWALNAGSRPHFTEEETGAEWAGGTPVQGAQNSIGAKPQSLASRSSPLSRGTWPY